MTLYYMNKGSFTQLVRDKASHRLTKVVTLAVTSCVLVTMIAIDASASPNEYATSIARLSKHTSALASETSLIGLFGLGLHHSTSGSSTSTTSSGASSGGSSGGGAAPAATTTTTSTTTTTTTSTTTTTTTVPTTPTTPATAGGLITAGPSRSECLEPDFDDTGLASLQAAVTSFDTLTNSNVTCVLGYLNGAANWTQWTNPWISTPGYGYTDWVAEDPSVRQLVLQVDLIPDSLENISDPLPWEQSCAAGDFNTYATELGENLVAAGLQNSVIRLGAEMNGAWEADFVGTTTQEQNLWAQCFANEVTGLRQAAGENFLIDWNPNAFNEDIPFANFYPGNAYVDILGLDQYDASGLTSGPFTFAEMATEPDGLNAFEAFAAAQGKPMSFPEWGLYASPGPGDDPQYVDGIGSTVENGNFAFEAYYDVGNDGTLALGPSTPLSLAEFTKWFGNS